MNRKFILSALLVSGLVASSPLFGQIKKLKTVKAEITREDRDIAKAKYDIDLVMENPETADNCAAFGWKGVVYGEIANLSDTSQLRKELDPNMEAAYIAGQSILKFYTYSAENQEILGANTAVEQSIPNIIINNYNKGIGALYQTGKKFDNVKKYMSLVEKLIAYDKEEYAKNNSITIENTYYNTWNAAYTDSLVNEEIPYLEKLANIPNYYKSDIFIRLSMIYSDRKDYEKALSYLEKGKEKIPQKSSEFLQQQINIELARNNQAVILAKFSEAIASEPENANYYFSRGVTYHQLKLNDLDVQEAAYKNDQPIPAAKYYFKQALADYSKAIQLDNSNFDAINNEAVAIFDSANYVYKQITRVKTTEADKYRTNASGMYRLAMSKFENLKQSGFLKGEDYINLLKDMMTCAARTNDTAKRDELKELIKVERAKLEGTN